MVNPYAIMPYHAIKPQFWRDFYHFIPISGDYLAVFLQHLPHQQGGSSHGGPGGVTLPWVHCNEVGFLADHHPIRQENAIRMCLKMEFWLVVLSHLPIWKILEWVRQLGWCSIPNWMEQNSSKAPGCMMISGYLWHFGEHWSNRSIPKNSRIFPWIRIPWEFMGIHGIPYGYFDVHQGYHGFWHTAISKNKIHPQNHSYNPPSLKLILPRRLAILHRSQRRLISTEDVPQHHVVGDFLSFLDQKTDSDWWRFTSSGWSSWYKMNIPSIVGQYLDKMVILG